MGDERRDERKGVGITPVTSWDDEGINYRLND